jgi:hypothetical protein
MSPEAAEKTLATLSSRFREAAIQTVIAMRSGDCIRDPKLFDHINDPIDRPRTS